MKNIMKKCIIIGLVICLISIFNMVTVYAEGADLKLTADKTSIAPGDTVTVVVKANCASNLSAISFKINYDKNVFDVVSKSIADGWANYSSGADVENLKYDLLSNSSEMFTQLDALTVVFKAKDNASGDFQITAENITITDISNNEFNVDTSSTPISISNVTPNPQKDVNEIETETETVPEKQEVVSTPAEEETVKSEEDKSVAKNKLPKAGIGKGLILSALIITITGIILYKKNQKYRGI